MDYDLLYENIVKGCSSCGGTGTVKVSDTEVNFCSCMEYYIFMIKQIENNVPLKYILNYKPIEIDDKKVYYLFKDDDYGFNMFMTLSKKYNMMLINSVNMFTANIDSTTDGVMIYNLGLETFQNNGIVLYRLIKEIEDRRLYGIFSFSIGRENLRRYYPEFIEQSVNGEI